MLMTMDLRTSSGRHNHALRQTNHTLAEYLFVSLALKQAILANTTSSILTTEAGNKHVGTDEYDVLI